ncbi:HpcH/HpaI aldolase/citrate lyase family protein [Nocardia sp. X0981]
MSAALLYLYVPGDRPERFAKAARSGADAVVLDLEDAVPVAAKDTARRAVATWLDSADRPDIPVWVRVNPGAELVDDVTAAVRGGVAGIWLPKCDDAAVLGRLDTLLTDLEKRFARARTPVSPLIETGTGLWNVRAVATGPRVEFLQIGEVDLAADLGITVTTGDELLWARSRVVAASAAAGLRPPLGAASPIVDDDAAFARETRRLVELGFHGRACIHPRQLAPAREGTTPTRAEVDTALDVLAAFEAAGGGAATDRRGRLIDEAVARHARRVLARRPALSESAG